MIDVASALAERYPGCVVLTWCCTHKGCGGGWTAPQGRWWPNCPRCGQRAEQRDAHVAIPIGAAA